jgi:hypothetical protein
MRNWFKKIFLSGFFLFALVACQYIKSNSNVPEIKVQKPLIINQPLILHYIGQTKSVRNVTIKARVDGYLEQRLFTDGDYLKKDQLLYIIDERPYQAQLLSAQGAVDKATADLTFQEVQYKRYQDLIAKNAVSKSVFDQQYASYLSAKGQLETAQGDYEKAKINLEFCRIHSPLDGLAGKTLVDPGNLVSSNGQTELLNVVQLNPIRVEFNPAASDLHYFNEYTKNNPFKVIIHLPKYSAQSWSGVIDFYNNVITSNTSTILLRTTVENKKLRLKPDLFVEVDVTLDPSHHFIYVPVTLVKSVLGLFQIWVVDESNILQIREIKTGRVIADTIEIKSGLKKGDLIVLEDNKYPSGSLVKPLIENSNDKKA